MRIIYGHRYTGICRLSLPLAPEDTEGRPVPAFEPPLGSRLVEHKTVIAPNSSRAVTRNPGNGKTKYVVKRDPGIHWLADTDIVCGSHGEAIFEIDADDPLTAKHTERVTQLLERGDWRHQIARNHL